ncbi:MAG: hypothetical protein AAF488_09110, partial [Planctomycetota bacterium]
MPLFVLCSVLWILPAGPEPTHTTKSPSVDEPAPTVAGDTALGVADAAHLLGRAGFGGSVEEILEFAR